MSAERPPSAVQSRLASSIRLAFLLIQIERRRPASQLSSTQAAICLPFPAPVPSPRK
jgi:hypothetical protein